MLSVEVMQHGNMKRRVLIVEDDRDVAELLAASLEGIAESPVDRAYDGPSGLARAESADYALVILDLMLPGQGGHKVCELIRSARPDYPVLAVTGRADLIPALLGKQNGFDDYVLKPCDLSEVRAKSQRLIERRLRAAGMPVAGESVPQPEALTLDRSGARVVAAGRPVQGLTLKEHEIVAFLVRHRGTAFSKEELFAAALGIHHPIPPARATVDFARLREKLTLPGGVQSCLILTEDDRYAVA
jgi:DNA-binding response OmpR family regulator